MSYSIPKPRAQYPRGKNLHPILSQQRLVVRITADYAGMPYIRSRTILLTPADLERLIDAACHLEAVR